MAKDGVDHFCCFVNYRKYMLCNRKHSFKDIVMIETPVPESPISVSPTSSSIISKTTSASPLKILTSSTVAITIFKLSNPYDHDHKYKYNIITTTILLIIYYHGFQTPIFHSSFDHFILFWNTKINSGNWSCLCNSLAFHFLWGWGLDNWEGHTWLNSQEKLQQ